MSPATLRDATPVREVFPPKTKRTKPAFRERTSEMAKVAQRTLFTQKEDVSLRHLWKKKTEGNWLRGTGGAPTIVMVRR